MPNIGGYETLIKLLLTEAGKYFALLLFSVLAIRLWRRWFKVSAVHKPKSLLLAGLATLVACGLGYAAICHSLSRLYLYYGMRAFNSGYLLSAFSLFEKSSEYWKNADAMGREGVCLLLSGKADEGLKLINEAAALRKGQSSAFEEFYEGVYYFFQEQPDRAIPLLEQSTADSTFIWSATKLFATFNLDNNQPKEAERLMKPFLQVEVTETDQAYVMASLNLAEGKKAEAQALFDKYATTNLPPFWKTRFDKLRMQLQK